MYRIHYEITDDDLKVAIKETKAYVNITAEQLKNIYAVAFRLAKARMASSIVVMDIMTKDVISIGKFDDVDDAIRMLSENNISGLPVVDRENRVIGVITEADILSVTGIKKEATFMDIIKHLFRGSMPEQRMGDYVGDVMSTPAVTVRPDDDICVAAKAMDENRVKRLPVVDEDNRLLGVISRADIVRALSNKCVSEVP
jgi:CBS-domain-containing membrane protein